MRAWRVVWVAALILALLAVTTTVAAQADSEQGGGRLIERPYTAVIEAFVSGAEFAAEVPFSGDTSDFGGACSEPADVVWRFRMAGLDGVFGHIDGTITVCVKAEWAVDATGAPTMTGMRYTDFYSSFSLRDGSTIKVDMTAQWEGFDAETGQLRSFVSWGTTGEGTGRYAGAKLFGTSHCRWYDPEALMAGVEPELCVMQGMIHYDPFAGRGE